MQLELPLSSRFPAIFNIQCRHHNLQISQFPMCGVHSACMRSLHCVEQVFFVFAVITNLLVSTSMLQGCVAVTYALTGVNIYGKYPRPAPVSPVKLGFSSCA